MIHRLNPVALLSLCCLASFSCAGADDPAPLTDSRGFGHDLSSAPAIVHYVNTVDVSAYGAIADDDLDDTDAIQAAIDAARDVPGSLVRLEAGTYRVSERDPIDWNALLVHEGFQLTIAGAGPEQTRIVFESERDAHVIALTDCVDVTLQGFAIDGRRENHVLGHGIRVANAEGIELRSLEIEHAAHFGIGLQRGALRAIAIDQVRVHDTGADGIDFNNQLGENEDISITNTFISQPGQTLPRQAGIDVRGTARLNAVTVVDVPQGGIGVRLHDAGSTLTDFHIAGVAGARIDEVDVTL